MDLINLKAKNVGVYTDKTVAKLGPMKVTLESLTKAGVNFKVYDDVRVEPTDSSFIKAANFAKEHNFDVILGMISHKISIISINGHNHIVKQKF